PHWSMGLAPSSRPLRPSGHGPGRRPAPLDASPYKLRPGAQSPPNGFTISQALLDGFTIHSSVGNPPAQTGRPVFPRQTAHTARAGLFARASLLASHLLSYPHYRGSDCERATRPLEDSCVEGEPDMALCQPPPRLRAVVLALCLAALAA